MAGKMLDEFPFFDSLSAVQREIDRFTDMKRMLGVSAMDITELDVARKAMLAGTADIQRTLGVSAMDLTEFSVFAKMHADAEATQRMLGLLVTDPTVSNTFASMQADAAGFRESLRSIAPEMSEFFRLVRAKNAILPEYAREVSDLGSALMQSGAAQQLAAVQEQLTPFMAELERQRHSEQNVFDHIRAIQRMSDFTSSFDVLHANPVYKAAVDPLDSFYETSSRYAESLIVAEDAEATAENVSETSPSSVRQDRSTLHRVQHAALADGMALLFEVIGVDPYFLRAYVEILTAEDVTLDEVDDARLHLVAAVNVVVPDDSDANDE